MEGLCANAVLIFFMQFWLEDNPETKNREDDSHEEYGTISNFQDGAQNGHRLNSTWQQTHSTFFFNIHYYGVKDGVVLKLAFKTRQKVKVIWDQGHLED